LNQEKTAAGQTEFYPAAGKPRKRQDSSELQEIRENTKSCQHAGHIEHAQIKLSVQLVHLKGSLLQIMLLQEWLLEVPFLFR